MKRSPSDGCSFPHPSPRGCITVDPDTHIGQAGCGIPGAMFLFFSSRLGCLSSLVISLALTALLLFLLDVL
ncbi:MAG: hypothetical protein ACRDTF_18260 [Pseudonocardiaceae bacterium]